MGRSGGRGIFRNKKPDVVLMDIMMPIKDGYSATAEIRKISQTVPIIAVTAYNLDKEELKRCGFSACERKPINRISFEARIKELLKR